MGTKPQPPNNDTVIWRYMDDWKFADMLGAGGKLGARMLGADHSVGFAAAV